MSVLETELKTAKRMWHLLRRPTRTSRMWNFAAATARRLALIR